MAAGFRLSDCSRLLCAKMGLLKSPLLMMGLLQNDGFDGKSVCGGYWLLSDWEILEFGGFFFGWFSSIRASLTASERY
jgi:hypothetical protein